MPGFLGDIYSPPGVYVRTLFENPVATTIAGLKIPVLLGTGNEILSRNGFEVIRGSSSTVDQKVPEEDVAGRAVDQITLTGEVILGEFDGERTKFQVRNFPIVSGDGSGTTTNDRGSVSVTVNGRPSVVLSVDGARGIVEITSPPLLSDEVRVTYYFNRTDTLITDNLSDQVTEDRALVRGEIGVTPITGTYTFVTGVNDELVVTVDQEAAHTITLPAGDFTPSQVAALINGQPTGSLAASAFTNNEGLVAVQLTADNDILIGEGSANGVLGMPAGFSTSRNRTFFTFHGPIVDGTNGGTTTTDTSKVVVKVNNIQVIPTSVDGANRAITLPYAPAPGDLVVVTYWFNTWQDTFDYLDNVNVVEVTRAGITPDRNDYIEGVDFILKDDRIFWGTSFLVSSGETTAGSIPFGENQVSGLLIDSKIYLAPTTPVVDTSVIPAADSRTQFQLPFQPTTGNGRNTVLDADLFSTISNDRVDLATSRPDLVTAYWGYDLQDAVDRGPVTVVKVDPDTSTITLQDPIPAGASVWATFYYNILVDQTYVLSVDNPGSTGFGTYTIQDLDGFDLFDVQFGTKSAGLAGFDIQFPRGSELFPDTQFVGGTPVEEIVTVTFANREDTPAKYSIPGPDPYYTITGESDHARILIDAADTAAGAAGVDISDPLGAGLGFVAHLMGDEVVYDAPSGGTTYDIDANNSEITLTVDGVLMTASTGVVVGGTVVDYANAINTASSAVGNEPEYSGATRFTSSVTIVAAEYDQLTMHYTGSASGVSGNWTITLTPGTYNSVNDLVTEINVQLATINGGGGLNGTVNCTANTLGQLTFDLTRAGGDATGFLEFIDNAAPASDFAILAGLDTDAATAGAQTKLIAGLIARTYSTPVAGERKHDRLILRNRLLPGSGSISYFHNAAQTELRVGGAPDPIFTGLRTGDYGLAGFQATVKPATLLGLIGLAGGQATGFADARDSQPLVTFYDGSGVDAANNVFKFTMDGTAVTVVFTASGSGTATPLGPDTIATTVLEQLQAAMVLAGLPATSAVQEGAAIRLISPSTGLSSRITIGDGNANGTLGFTDGAVANRTNVDVREIASALMQHNSAAVATAINTWILPTATYFAAEAFAWFETDAVGAEYLYLQSQSLGITSSIAWAEPTADSVLLPGTGLLATVGDGAIGETGLSGFYVTSTDPADGSGTANTSVLNSGVGQDGFVGQTYQDDVTGLMFTILEREGGGNYPAGESFSFLISKTFVTDTNIPTRAIPGLELLVSNTSGMTAGDTALVQTFEKGGFEPAVGDSYYVSYNYVKRDFDQKLYTKLSAIEAEFGTVSPNNPVSLGAYLMLINGAVVIGIKQVQKDDGLDTASLSTWLEAIDDLARPFPGTAVDPDVIVPLKGNDGNFFNYLSQHLDIQSSVRFAKERTAIVGLAPITNPEEAGNIAQSIGRTRFRLVYPDSALLTLQDFLGNQTQYVVEGFYIAAALTGAIVDPAYDVASPWTNRRLRGFDQLGRTLDAVQANQVAVRGVTVILDDPPIIKVRQGLTTDMTNILTQLPTIIQIADDVQQQSRKVLDRFIGVKFISGILNQVEGVLASMFKEFVRANIVKAYTNIQAVPDPDNPTSADIEAFYSPVFPLLYLLLTYNLRSSL